MNTIFLFLGYIFIFFSLTSPILLLSMFYNSMFYKKHRFVAITCNISIIIFLGYFGSVLIRMSKQNEFNEFKTLATSSGCSLQSANLKITGKYKVDFLCNNGTRFQKEMSWEDVSEFIKTSNKPHPGTRVSIN